ncbi:MAG: hypothetical protein ACRDFC_05580 [Ignavibacteria bacterium]
MVNKKTYTGLFLTALATLMYEILITRIFSVTMGYHFAFMAVSIAMFGMTVGAILVYLFPKFFVSGRIKIHLTYSALLFSITIIASFLIHLFIPFKHSLSVSGFSIIAVTYTVISVPFVFSGICVCLLLTRFTEYVNKLYASDLSGASLGCILVVIVINISGGPTAVFFTSFVAALSALFFAYNELNRRLIKIIIFYSFLVGTFAVVHTVLVINQNPILRLYWIRGEYAEKPLYEKWNSFSRVSIDGDSSKLEVPFGWGLSNTYDRNKKVKQLMLNIDAHSTTVLSAFDGNIKNLEHLKYDVSNIVHYLRKESDVLIIGSGGGRDVLSSLLFEQKSILGIEINQDMIRAITNDFGNFTGHLDKYPNVRFVGDEARSYLQRLNEKFDIIQVSVIDNWPATSSGAIVLTENALYTMETWRLFLDRLKPNGILTITRFYRKKPAEIYRLVSMSASALKEIGIENPRKHIIVLKCSQIERQKDHSGTSTILVCKSPFKPDDINVVNEVSNSMEFETVLSPAASIDSNFVIIASGREQQEDFIKNFPVDIKPPTDDKPFFFHLLKFSDMFNVQFWKEWDMAFNVKAIFILSSLLVTMLLFTVLCIIIPIRLTAKRVSLKGAMPLFVFFAGIGFGFMLVEISQIQRLNIFLGHPTYSLSAALFTLLLSSGIGSYVSEKRMVRSQSGVGEREKNFKKFVYVNLFLLLTSLLIFGIFTPYIITAFREYETSVRIIIAVLILFPAGLFMGTAFPLGIKLASSKNNVITPWLWGINGVTSVTASVIAIVIAMSSGISMSFWAGFFCYLIAAVSVLRAVKQF